jgi:upstream activation factor subunit UAF30
MSEKEVRKSKQSRKSTKGAKKSAASTASAVNVVERVSALLPELDAFIKNERVAVAAPVSKGEVELAGESDRRVEIQRSVEDASEYNNNNAGELEPATTTSTRLRRRVDKERIQKAFDELIVQLAHELDATKEDKHRKISVNVFKRFIRMARILKQDCDKVMAKPRARRTDMDRSQYGFEKPKPVTKLMADFAGWNSAEPKSRVDVTRSICTYAKTNNLQNPENKREIIPDAKLARLLGLDAGKKTITYWELQKELYNCFEGGEPSRRKQAI